MAHICNSAVIWQKPDGQLVGFLTSGTYKPKPTAEQVGLFNQPEYLEQLFDNDPSAAGTQSACFYGVVKNQALPYASIEILIEDMHQQSLPVMLMHVFKYTEANGWQYSQIDATHPERLSKMFFVSIDEVL